MFHRSASLNICKRCYRKLQQLGCRTYTTDREQKWTSKEARQAFLDYFCVKNDHTFVKSSSVIPQKDAGTYFTNAGMNQFKPIFQGTVVKGTEMASYKKVANSQKCVRVGGKHNDLNDVGQDLTHHTFFEMLGNWSFGAYGKEEACRLALTLLTDVYKIPIDRLYFTYFDGDRQLGLGPDLETRLIWKELGVPSSRILPCGSKDNFWDMGDIGPCGPCTEIHYDHSGSNLTPYKVNADLPDVVEIWNLVFIQYDRKKEGSLSRLPQMHVDTGIGFERMCAVLNGTMSNYDTDLFLPLIDSMQKYTGAPVYTGHVGSSLEAKLDTAYRIIADHIRMATVCISEGILPGRSLQESKLRLVIYRALYQCHEVLKSQDGLLEHLVDIVSESLGEVYPEISQNQNQVKEVLKGSEQKYLKLSSDGKSSFTKLLKKHPDVKELNEDLIKKLHEGWFGRPLTLDMIEIMSDLHKDLIKKLHEGWFGRPLTLDMIEIIADLHGITVNEADMHNVQTQTQKKSLPEGSIPKEDMYPSLTSDIVEYLKQYDVEKTDESFVYQYTKQNGSYDFPDVDSIIMHLLDKDNKLVDSIQCGEKIGIIVDNTNFYSEKGGQLGDKGLITTETGTANITSTQINQGYIIHVGVVTEGHIETSQEAILVLDTDFRQGCMRNHTATHLLNTALRHVLGSDVRQRGSFVGQDKFAFDFSSVNAALRHVLGSDVRQRGSFVGQDKLCFDFSSVSTITDDNLREIESMVNSFIQSNVPLHRELRPFTETKKDDSIIYLENADYPSEVYVVQFNDSTTDSVYRSAELCAGTHVLETGDIGRFCVTSLTGVAVYGTKDIVCLTGPHADKAISKGKEALDLVEDLERSIESEQKVDHCLDLMKHIGSLNFEEMPKLVRDEVQKRKENARFSISTLQNKQVFSQFKYDLNEIMVNDDHFGIYHMAMKVLPKLTKMMKAEMITKPFILVVDTSNNTSAYVCLPTILEDSLEDLVNDFKDAVKGTVSVREKNFHIVKRSGKHTKRFMDSAEKVLTEFCTDYVDKIKS